MGSPGKKKKKKKDFRDYIGLPEAKKVIRV